MRHLEVWRTAIGLVQEYGDAAPSRAELRAEEYVLRDLPDEWAYWVWIEVATEECLRVERHAGESVH